METTTKAEMTPAEAPAKNRAAAKRENEPAKNAARLARPKLMPAAIRKGRLAARSDNGPMLSAARAAAKA